MAQARPPWWIVGLAATFLGYHTLLVYCDARRPEPIGILFSFSHDVMLVTGVLPGTPAERGGLATRDVILACDGQKVRNRYDWMAFLANVEVGRPLHLTVDRGGVHHTVRVALGWQQWRWADLRESVTRMGVRAVQTVTLLLAMVIVFKRPGDAVARMCAWVLGTFGVLSVVLQYRVAAVWRGLGWLGAPLWLPFLSAGAVGAVLFTFFAVFPRVRVRSTTLWALVWTPLLLAIIPHASYMADVVYRPTHLTDLHDRWIGLVIVNLGYLIAAVSVLVVNYRRLEDVNERRRVRVLAIGSIVGCATGGAFVLFIWLTTSNLALYESPGVSVGALLLLVMPVSFAYAILRHRMFDVRVIVRQGVRYGVARGVLLSLVPLLVGALATDVALHRSQSIEDVLAARGWIYGTLAGVAIAAHSQRKRWLDALDRRFFRERYDARRLLSQVVEEVRHAGDLARVAARVVASIEAALHPAFAALLVPEPSTRRFLAVASSPAGAAPEALPSDGKWAALVAVLGKPIDVPAGSRGWLADQLPTEDLDVLRRSHIEVLVPVPAGPDRLAAVLALGGKRSEEPYSREDRDLLAAIAGGLALVTERPVGSPSMPQTLVECPRCGACYDSTVTICPDDGASPGPSRVPRVLAARYRLDRRLGRGGMGTVYRAVDTALDRQVAVKMIREDLAGHAETAARFHQEARAAAAFAHPNVVTVHDFGVEGGAHAYLVMELLEGVTLRESLRREQRFAPSRVRGIMRDVAAAVDAAHRRQLVHRDLKPENVFLVRTGDAETAKILDFGIAKALHAADGATTMIDTQAGSLVGTPQYMAPEQLRGDEVGPAWDLWAMAVMTYEMLVGRLPFSGFRIEAGVDEVPGGPLAAMLAPLAAAPPAWRTFFTRALAHDPVARPESARTFYADLDRALLATV